MKRGNSAVPFKELGSSPAKQIDLTRKKGLGPIAEKKKLKEDNVPLDPGFEDPIKIQKVQREGLTPHSQKFSKKAVKSTTTAHGQLNDAQLEYEEDKKAVGTNIITPPVMKSGSKNRVLGIDLGKDPNWRPNPKSFKK